MRLLYLNDKKYVTQLFFFVDVDLNRESLLRVFIARWASLKEILFVAPINIFMKDFWRIKESE